ncbi:MAG: hypothetical protein ACRD34_01150 [Bryobacteraceae bacterium]
MRFPSGIYNSPKGTFIAEGHFYPFSSVFFYADRGGLLLNGRTGNLEYGSCAPDCPNVFIDDAQLQALWKEPKRFCLALYKRSIPRLKRLIGAPALHLVIASGDKDLFTNHALPQPSAQPH